MRDDADVGGCPAAVRVVLRPAAVPSPDPLRRGAAALLFAVVLPATPPSGKASEGRGRVRGKSFSFGLTRSGCRRGSGVGSFRSSRSPSALSPSSLHASPRLSS
eukprot:scaffold10_cov257-Pinguiococcus_pyrenoidosus.AAC.66